MHIKSKRKHEAHEACDQMKTSHLTAVYSTVYLDEPTSNIHTEVVDGNKHSSTFSFADFLEVRLKFCTTFGWKPASSYSQETSPHVHCVSSGAAASSHTSMFCFRPFSKAPSSQKGSTRATKGGQSSLIDANKLLNSSKLNLQQFSGTFPQFYTHLSNRSTPAGPVLPPALSLIHIT